MDAVPGLEASLRSLYERYRPDALHSRPLGEMLHDNFLPTSLRENPKAVIPYLVLRDHFLQRLHQHDAGYWQSNGEGMELFTRAEWAAVLDRFGNGPTLRSAASRTTCSPGATLPSLSAWAELGLLRYGKQRSTARAPASGPWTCSSSATIRSIRSGSSSTRSGADASLRPVAGSPVEAGRADGLRSSDGHRSAWPCGSGALGRVITRVYDAAHCAPTESRFAQLNLLTAIVAADGARPTDLVRILDVEKSTLSRDLQRMEHLGWIPIRSPPIRPRTVHLAHRRRDAPCCFEVRTCVEGKGAGSGGGSQLGRGAFAGLRNLLAADRSMTSAAPAPAPRRPRVLNPGCTPGSSPAAWRCAAASRRAAPVPAR